MASLISLIDIHPANDERYVPFIGASMRGSLGASPCRPLDVDRQVQAVLRITRGCEGKSYVATLAGHPDDYVGWVASLDGDIAYVYVRKPMREQGIGAHLISLCTDETPISFAFWSLTASKMALKGFPVVHDLDAFEKVQTFYKETNG